MRSVPRQVLAVLALLLAGAPGLAQPAPPPAPDTASTSSPPSPPDGDSGPPDKESSVGYIDSALPRSQFRLRFDAAYNFVRTTRAEFFWARTINPGLPKSETNLDYQ